MLAAIAVLMPAGEVAAQETAERDSLWQLDLEQVVVTGTRSERELSTVPVPVRLIPAKAIEESGAMRLSELLEQQTGLTMVADHGMGVQMQGFSSDYTLILVDGEPIIGRTAGTLDLDRITVSGIERIEIVEGPSSSLYGSEALAGVINIITRRPDESLRLAGEARYETFGTVDLSTSSSGRKGPWEGRLMFNHHGSAGYDLYPEIAGVTVPGFVDQTFQAGWGFRPNDQTSITGSLRMAGEHQQSLVGLNLDGQSTTFDEIADRREWSYSQKARHRMSSAVTGSVRGFYSQYGTVLSTRASDEDFESSAFDQEYGKVETQFDLIGGDRHLAVLGAGGIYEKAHSDRIDGGSRNTVTGFLFGQYEFMASDQFNFLTSARLDRHSEYGTHVSPKVAMLYRPAKEVQVRASVGTGFKAPTFQQLYLDFTNAVAGYSVFGSANVSNQLGLLDDRGLVSQILAEAISVADLKPETALSYQAGLDWRPRPETLLRVGVFRNNVRDLIETSPIAIKTNGQNVFSYFNLDRIYTQGVSLTASSRLAEGVDVSAGYQFLDAQDLDVREEIKAGTVFGRTNGQDRRLSLSDYGGLFNRSRHSGTLSIRYEPSMLPVTVSTRFVFRGRYGFGDTNGNLILDDASEYVPGHVLGNLNVSWELPYGITAFGGSRNLFDVQNREHVPSLPGRLFFGGMRFEFKP